MKKKDENYLDKKPVRANLKWDIDDDGNVTLHVENKGAMPIISGLKIRFTKEVTGEIIK